MSSDNTISGGEADSTDYGDLSLRTDISQTFTNLSSKNRAKRRQEKLRRDLVQEHFEQKQRPKSRFKSILGKFL